MCSLGLWAKASLTELNICCVKSFLKIAVAGIHVIGGDLRVHYLHKPPAPLAGNKWVDCVTLLTLCGEKMNHCYDLFLLFSLKESWGQCLRLAYLYSGYLFFFFLYPFEVQLTGGMK